MPNQIIHNIDNIKIIEYEKSNVYIIEDILENLFCDNLRELIDTLPLNKIDFYNGNNVQCNITHVDELLKTNDELYYKFSTDSHKYKEILNKINLKKPFYTNKLNGITNNMINQYNSNINGIMLKIKNIMSNVNKHIIFDNHTGFILRKIYGETRIHIDNISEIYDNVYFIKENKNGDYKMIRNSSMIFTLNDDYDGGMFNFPYYDITVKLKKGSVIIFPPFWTHEHQVYKVENNTYRYTLSTWTCEKI
jgi:predicted MPP superfamily phosphohydrolase